MMVNGEDVRREKSSNTQVLQSKILCCAQAGLQDPHTNSCGVANERHFTCVDLSSSQPRVFFLPFSQFN